MPLVPAPIVPTNPTGGTQFAGGGGSASGMLPVSGVLTGSDFSGPHYIETQTMNVAYIRVPHFNWSATDWALSGQLPTYYNITNTILHAIVTCNVTKQKSFDVYATSGWTQPQTFAVNAASADSYGNIYGTAAEFSSTYVLGPEGSVVTEQEYYNRRPWLEGIDSTITSSVTGYTWVMGQRETYWNGNESVVVSSVLPANTEYGNFENGWRWGGFDPNQFLYDPYVGAYKYTYYINNEYRYTQENFTKLISFVDYECGDEMRSGDLWPIHPSGSGTWQDPYTNVGLSIYDPTRHNWTSFS